MHWDHSVRVRSLSAKKAEYAIPRATKDPHSHFTSANFLHLTYLHDALADALNVRELLAHKADANRGELAVGAELRERLLDLLRGGLVVLGDLVLLVGLDDAQRAHHDLLKQVVKSAEELAVAYLVVADLRLACDASEQLRLGRLALAGAASDAVLHARRFHLRDDV